MLRITFLGTAAARPTPSRGTSAIAVQREHRLFLFDCGEGTQRQMMRFGSGFGIEAIFVTHLHADHFLGIIGLTRTLGLQEREAPLRIIGPPGSTGVLRTAIQLGGDRLPFEVEILEAGAGEVFPMDGFRIEAFDVRHGVPAVGWALREDLRPGRFDLDRARALGIPPGPLYGALQRGERVEWDGGSATPEQVLGPPRAGRLVVYTGDTRPTESTATVASGADLLIHDATFLEEERERARQTYHTTAAEAARMARKARVQRLVLTHLSARHTEHAAPLEREARRIFRASSVAHDGLVIELPLPGDPPPRELPEAPHA